MPYNPEDPRVWFFVGVGATLFLGWLWLMYREWVKQRNAYGKPQAVIQTTKKSPAEVARDSAAASRKIFFLRLAFLIGIWAFVEFRLYPGATATFVDWVTGFFSQ